MPPLDWLNLLHFYVEQLPARIVELLQGPSSTKESFAAPSTRGSSFPPYGKWFACSATSLLRRAALWVAFRHCLSCLDDLPDYVDHLVLQDGGVHSCCRPSSYLPYAPATVHPLTAVPRSLTRPVGRSCFFCSVEPLHSVNRWMLQDHLTAEGHHDHLSIRRFVARCERTLQSHEVGFAFRPVSCLGGREALCVPWGLFC